MDNSLLNIKLVIFSVISNRLKVFLRGNVLPHGLLIQNKSLDKGAEEIFRSCLKMPFKNLYFEQLYTFSSYEKKGISVVYYFLVPEHKLYSKDNDWIDINIELLTGSGLKGAKGLTLISKYDKEIILYALQRLRWKIEYTNAVYSFLPDEFTFSQLQSVYEAILGKTLDKRNFRKKMLSLGILEDTGHIKKLGKSRPAEMFSFKKRELTFVEIL